MLFQGASNVLDVVGRKYSGRLSDSHPSNWDARLRPDLTADVYGAAQGDTAGVPHAGAVEHHGPRGNEDLVLQHCARHVGMGTNQHVATKTYGMVPGPSQHGLLHHHAARAYLDAAAVIGEDRLRKGLARVVRP